MSLSNKKGFVLAHVIGMFIMANSIIFLIHKFISANVDLTISQQNRIKSYYCMMSGLEMGYTALVDKNQNSKSILENYKNNELKGEIKDKIDFKNFDPNINATVEITISLNPENRYFIQITSNSILKDSKQKIYSSKGKMEVNINNADDYVYYVSRPK